MILQIAFPFLNPSLSGSVFMSFGTYLLGGLLTLNTKQNGSLAYSYKHIFYAGHLFFVKHCHV